MLAAARLAALPAWLSKTRVEEKDATPEKETTPEDEELAEARVLRESSGERGTGASTIRSCGRGHDAGDGGELSADDDKERGGARWNGGPHRSRGVVASSLRSPGARARGGEGRRGAGGPLISSGGRASSRDDRREAEKRPGKRGPTARQVPSTSPAACPGFELRHACLRGVAGGELVALREPLASRRRRVGRRDVRRRDRDTIGRVEAFEFGTNTGPRIALSSSPGSPPRRCALPVVVLVHCSRRARAAAPRIPRTRARVEAPRAVHDAATLLARRWSCSFRCIFTGSAARRPSSKQSKGRLLYSGAHRV